MLEFVVGMSVDRTLSTAVPPPTIPAPYPTTPVASDQWPYDVNLLAAIFQNLHAPLSHVGNVGVADPRSRQRPTEVRFLTICSTIAGTSVPTTTGMSSARGVKRNVNDIVATGDVSLCSGTVQPPFSGWDAYSFKFASHASITVSLAGALRARQRFPAVGNQLPRVVFFRMLPNACDPRSSFDPGEGAMAPAFTYLAQRSDVIVYPLHEHQLSPDLIRLLHPGQPRVR